MKITVSIIALRLCVPALGQTSLADYRAAVADYSWQLKIAASKSDAAAETAGQARTGYLPRLAMDGSFTATVRHFAGVERRGRAGHLRHDPRTQTGRDTRKVGKTHK